MAQHIDINKLRLDGGTQLRAALNRVAIEDYTEAYLDGKKMPPVKVIFDGKNYWPWDGFHRIQGALAAGKRTITADIEEGTQRDALIRAAGANAEHGVPRTQEDRRNAVTTILQDDEFALLSDREVARMCNVSHTLVAQIRRPKERVVPPPPGPSAPPAPTPIGGNIATLEQPEEGSSEADPTVATPRDTSAQQSGPTTVKPQGTKALGRLEEITAERDQLRDENAELRASLAELLAENNTMAAAMEADDALASVQAELKQERAARQAAEERMAGLMNEKAAAIRLAESWKRRAEKAAA